MSQPKKIIVTHHSPDLDAIGSVWLLKRFDAQTYASSKIKFTNPGDRLKAQDINDLRVAEDEITHVDTGLGKFDHHQPERANPNICAASLVYDYICQIHPELKEDKALAVLVKLITQIDHFKEINWPEASNLRYTLMLHEILRGYEAVDPHNDESQMAFGLKCIDCVYAALTQSIKAEEILSQKGREFNIKLGKCVGVLTRNDYTIKYGQKIGYILVVKKDPDRKHIRIKTRPDAQIDLKKLHHAITEIDSNGTWFYHPSGKMLINGSRKHASQIPSNLSLQQVIDLIIKLYN